MATNVLVDAARVVSAVVAVGALQSARAVLHHVATQQFQVRVGVHAVRAAVQLQRNTRQRSYCNGRLLRDRTNFGRRRRRVLSVRGAALRRRNARFPWQQVAVAGVLQRDGTLFQHLFHTPVLLWIAHVGHGHVQTDVLRPEVLSHAPPARFRIRTMYTPTTGKGMSPTLHQLRLQLAPTQLLAS